MVAKQPWKSRFALLWVSQDVCSAEVWKAGTVMQPPFPSPCASPGYVPPEGGGHLCPLASPHPLALLEVCLAQPHLGSPAINLYISFTSSWPVAPNPDSSVAHYVPNEKRVSPTLCRDALANMM